MKVSPHLSNLILRHILNLDHLQPVPFVTISIIRSWIRSFFFPHSAHLQTGELFFFSSVKVNWTTHSHLTVNSWILWYVAAQRKHDLVSGKITSTMIFQNSLRLMAGTYWLKSALYHILCCICHWKHCASLWKDVTLWDTHHLHNS